MRAEHISIEAEADVAAPPARPPHRKVRSTYVLASSLRKCATELSLLDDHYLQVQSVRNGKEQKKYAIDLRFLNSQPTRRRHIAWGWFAAASTCLIGAGTALAFAMTRSSPFFSTVEFVIGCSAMLVSLGTLVLGMRNTTETLNFTSVNGGATLVSVVGGIGSTKHGKAFFVAMIKDISAAKAARPQAKPQLLRDEMREHHRLREIGVLSEADYEDSKAKILRAHA